MEPVATRRRVGKTRQRHFCSRYGSRSSEGVGYGGCLFLRTHDLASLKSRASSDRQRGTHRRAAGILGPGTDRTFGKGRRDCFRHPDVSAETNVDNWALETLRFVENLDQQARCDPTSIPAYIKDGFECVQKLKLTFDEAQFASQFNGIRSVQQIAKNLRLDLKSTHLMLFRFLALEIVECWPASTATKPEPKSVFQRFKRLTGRGR